MDLVRGATGWNTSLWEIMRVGERAVNLTRLYNFGEGFGVQHDFLPERFFQPFLKGPLKGVRVSRKNLRTARKMFYQMMGWSAAKGVPGRGVLDDLGISWAYDIVKQHKSVRRKEK